MKIQMSRFSRGSTPRRALVLLTLALAAPGLLPAAQDAPVPQAAQSGAPQQSIGAPPQAPGSPVRDSVERAPAHGQATLMLAPSRFEVAAGAAIRMNLTILGAQNMTRLPVTVRYDGDVLGLIRVSLGTAWNEGPAPVFLHDSGRPGELVIGIAHMGEAAGVVGIGSLLDLEFRALQPGETRVWLERFAVIGADSTSQPARAIPATIIVR